MNKRFGAQLVYVLYKIDDFRHAQHVQRFRSRSSIYAPRGGSLLQPINSLMMPAVLMNQWCLRMLSGNKIRATRTKPIYNHHRFFHGIFFCERTSYAATIQSINQSDNLFGDREQLEVIKCTSLSLSTRHQGLVYTNRCPDSPYITNVT